MTPRVWIVWALALFMRPLFAARYAAGRQLLNNPGDAERWSEKASLSGTGLLLQPSPQSDLL
jgi:hypothetical protein